MKIFALLSGAAVAVPQRHLAPGLRNREKDGRPARFHTDDGYTGPTAYDFEANKNVNAKTSEFSTSMMLNFLCRGSPNDDLCKNGLEGIYGLVPAHQAKLYDIGKVDGDNLTLTNENTEPVLRELAKFSKDEIKALIMTNLVKETVSGKDSINWGPTVDNGLRPDHQPHIKELPVKQQMLAQYFNKKQTQPVRKPGIFGLQQRSPFRRHQQGPIIKHMVWNKICATSNNLICLTRDSLKTRYANYASSMKNVYSKTAFFGLGKK
jgi:hypothetical protein